MYWIPKSKLGGVSFLLAFVGFVLFYVQYWIAMWLGEVSTVGRVVFIGVGFVALGFILAGGVCSVFALFKYKDRAFSLYVSLLIGLLGLILLLGELFISH